MAKNSQTSTTATTEADDGLGDAPASILDYTVLNFAEPTHASVRLTRPVDVNGGSFIAGAMLNNLPIATAHNLVAHEAAVIISTSTKSYTSNAIEDQLPGHLDPAVYCVHPGLKIVGQPSNVYVLRADVEAGLFNR